jgi:hypothetical protein
MFGRNKKVSQPDPFITSLNNKIVHNVTDDRDDFSRRSHYVLPQLPYGQINASIPIEQLNQLPLHHRIHWKKLDLEKIFHVEAEESEMEKISNTPVNVILLSKEQKLQLRAQALGLSRKNKYAEKVGLD